MAISKQIFKTKPVSKVTFSIINKEANQVSVVGDFNDWNAEEGKLSKLKNGTFKAAFSIPANASYEFKYIVDGVYINDEEADGYVWNEFANCENALLVL
ncbi:MAG TPA: glycoside hydrolase [Flavobacterium sp.]|nr:glycoside hydrolase [Flavobacterium sp.]